MDRRGCLLYRWQRWYDASCQLDVYGACVDLLYQVDNFFGARMRSKNSKPIDPLERAYMADVKSVRCVFCDAPPPVEAHHVKQGRHFCTVAACKMCHDAKAWRIGKPNEFDAVNETRRRVEQLRSGAQVHPRRNMISVPAPKRKGSALTSDKILKHGYVA